MENIFKGIGLLSEAVVQTYETTQSGLIKAKQRSLNQQISQLTVANNPNSGLAIQQLQNELTTTINEGSDLNNARQRGTSIGVYKNLIQYAVSGTVAAVATPGTALAGSAAIAGAVAANIVDFGVQYYRDSSEGESDRNKLLSDFQKKFSELQNKLNQITADRNFRFKHRSKGQSTRYAQKWLNNFQSAFS